MKRNQENQENVMILFSRLVFFSNIVKKNAKKISIKMTKLIKGELH